jgi:diguanylate cyclase (GGDEF)-like protein/PAS domain S-box-containing protein
MFQRFKQFLTRDKLDRGDTKLALRLDLALNNISQGLCFFDGSHRLIVCNNRYIEMYGLPPDRVRPGLALRDIVEMRIQAGTGPTMTKEDYLAWRDNIAISDTATDTVVTLRNGRTISIRHRPMPDGGWVATHEDITVDRKREESFRLLFRNNPVPMWVIDLATLRFLDVNDAAVGHYGYPRETFLTMSATDLRSPEERHEFLSQILGGAKTQGTIPWRHRKADGQQIEVNVYAEDLEFNGQTARLCAAVDISERRRSEIKLLDQKLQIDAAIENMSQGLVMFDAEARIVLFNRRYTEMYNLSEGVVHPGCTLRALIEHRKQVGLFSGDPETYCEEIVEAIRSGKTLIKSLELPDGRTIQIINKPMPGGGWVVTHDDITEIRRAQERIQRESNEHRRLFELSQDMILVTDRRGTIVRVSPIVESVLGYRPDELVGKGAVEIVWPDDLDETRTAMRLAREGRSTRNCETRYIRKDGRIVTLAWSGVWSEPEGIYFFICRDVTERKAIDARLRQLAHYDLLTGLPNRESLWNDLSELMYAGAEPDGRQMSVAMFDLDGFKDVNDTLGHSTGDRLLLEVARRMSELAPPKARFYRLGGDEFVLVLSECGDPLRVGGVVDSVVKAVGTVFEISGQELYIGASAGIAIAFAHGSSVDEVLSNADLALYEAKAAGGRCYRIFMPALRAKAETRRELDAELRRAWEHREFVLHFQPQIRLGDGAIVGAEALLRWQHPDRGLVSPGAFIDALADSPIVHEVGRWILETACETAVALRARGHALRMGVNLFPAQFHGERLQTEIEMALARSDLPAEFLEIEITENIALGQDDRLLGPLRSLRNRGIQLAFDDFGTGYASLSFLTRYPLTRLKIDQSFVRKINERSTSEDTAIVRSIIMMAHNLGLSVIAEGVETAAQAAFLQSEQCDEVQGFLYARPLDVEKFEEFLVAGQVRAQSGRLRNSAA